MSPDSFYVGPGKPVLRVTGWDDLVTAAQTGVLAETQWVELKAALPATASAANLELAKDLASLSVDGGVYIVGVRNPGNQADHVVGTTDDLENLKSRIDQVAGSLRIQPQLNVQMTPLSHPTDLERYVLIVTVPASASAPHMVDEKYWGRGATGKRPLADVEVSRLFAQRRGRRDDFKDRLENLSTDLDLLSPMSRRYGHLYVMVEQNAAPMGPPLANALGNNPLQAVLDSVSFNAAWRPALESLNNLVGHPDGVALASVPHDHIMEEYLLYLLLSDGGSVQLASGQGTRQYGDEIGISVNYIMEIVHQMLQLAAHLGATYLHYGGPWRVGVHVQGLEGRFPSQALTERESEVAMTRRFSPFQTATYTRTAAATTRELAERTPVVVEKLLRDLARGVDLQDYFFPYTDPSEISQKV